MPWSRSRKRGSAPRLSRLTRRAARAITSIPKKRRRCSSVVEQRIRNARVVGSIPTTGFWNSPQARSDDR
jgi:hypothetical protein